MPIIDDYLLKSSEQFQLGSTEEGRTDLTLTQSVNATGRVRGIVIDASTGDPIGDAVVKLRTQSGDPVIHTLTNPAGRYSISGVAPGSYTLNVAKENYQTSTGQTFTIIGNQILEIDVSLTPLPVTNIVYGVISDLATGDPISGAYVVLVSDLAVAQNVIQSISGSDGEYIMSGIPDGSRPLFAEIPGYYVSTFIPIDISGGSIINTDISLQPYQYPQGTVNGYIKNQSGNPVSDACVGLYLIDQQGVELLQKVTFTDSTGFYIFGRIPAGTYVVKAKSETTVSSL